MKKVSVNKWKKLLPKEKATEVEANVHFVDTDDVLPIKVKPYLEMMERMAFAKEVAESCFDDVDGSYIPYAFDVSLGIMLVQYFTNIDVGADIVTAFALVQNSDVVAVIKSIVDERTMDHLETEVYELLQWQKSRRMRSTKADELYDALTMLIEKFSQMADSARSNLDDGKITDLAEVLKRFGNQEDTVKAILTANKEIK